MRFWLVVVWAVFVFSGPVWSSGGDDGGDVVFDYVVQKVEKRAERHERNWVFGELAFASLEMRDFERALRYYSRIERSDFYNVLEELMLHCRREEDFKRLAWEIEKLEQPLSKALTYYPLATLSLKLELGDEVRAEILEKFRELDLGKKEEDVVVYWGIAVRLCTIINDDAHEKAVDGLMADAKTLILAHPDSRNYTWLVEEYNRTFFKLYGRLDEEVFEIWRKEFDGDFSKTVKLIMFFLEIGELKRARQLLTRAIHRLPDEKCSAKNLIKLSEGLSEAKVESDESAARFFSSEPLFIDALVGCMPPGQNEPNPDLRDLVFKSVIDFLIKTAMS
jgi:tetratricopeptide (TPR) repeat protein